MIADPRLGTVDLKAKDELIKIHSKVHYLEENVQNFMLKHVYSSFKINLSDITANYDNPSPSSRSILFSSLSPRTSYKYLII